jgi:hypothetical protein
LIGIGTPVSGGRSEPSWRLAAAALSVDAGQVVLGYLGRGGLASADGGRLLGNREVMNLRHVTEQ